MNSLLDYCYSRTTEDEPEAVFQRKIIVIDAASTPNVKLGLEQLSRGIEPTNEVVTPGILTFAEYQHRLEKWDEKGKCNLRGEFHEGKWVSHETFGV
jgi:hypothetical protein